VPVASGENIFLFRNIDAGVVNPDSNGVVEARGADGQLPSIVHYL
jgi:hypothetical protein